tara:strand:- start:1737 stop:2417 length:681 start_codon:yes stop_codon:yes gene_type:complete
MTKTKLLIISLLLLIISLVVSYNSQINSRHDFSSESSSYPEFCKFSFSSGFPFIFYEIDHYDEGPGTKDKCWNLIQGTYKIPFDQIKMGFFIIDILILTFLIFLVLELPYFILSEKLKTKLSIKRLILSAIIGFIWAFLGFGFFYSAGLSGGASLVTTIILYILFLPTGLTILIQYITWYLLGTSASVGYHIFSLGLPFIFATIIIYLITELINRKRTHKNILKQK